MGRSAKVHKRLKKTVSPPAAQPKPPSLPVQSAKKRAGLKSKAKAKSKGEHVLNGADYVTLLLGGRRRAADEALKLRADKD